MQTNGELDVGFKFRLMRNRFEALRPLGDELSELPPRRQSVPRSHVPTPASILQLARRAFAGERKARRKKAPADLEHLFNDRNVTNFPLDVIESHDRRERRPHARFVARISSTPLPGAVHAYSWRPFQTLCNFLLAGAQFSRV